MSNFNYELLKGLCTELLISVETILSRDDLREIQDYVDANEYGLALQTFVDIVVEEEKRLPPRAAGPCEELARLMQLTDELNLQAICVAAS